jgi:hypothetical protein
MRWVTQAASGGESTPAVVAPSSSACGWREVRRGADEGPVTPVSGGVRWCQLRCFTPAAENCSCARRRPAPSLPRNRPPVPRSAVPRASSAEAPAAAVATNERLLAVYQELVDRISSNRVVSFRCTPISCPLRAAGEDLPAILHTNFPTFTPAHTSAPQIAVIRA